MNKMTFEYDSRQKACDLQVWIRGMNIEVAAFDLTISGGYDCFKIFCEGIITGGHRLFDRASGKFIIGNLNELLAEPEKKEKSK